ncbi:MAG: type II toxin-antitoxin system VapC family toxin [Chloroflexota bacterium]
MIALLDTHGLLWDLLVPHRLSARAAQILQDPGARVLVSAASAWEIAIKLAKGKVRLPVEPASLLEVVTRDLRMEPVPVEFAHAIAAADLPPIHADPFDRLLVAQARILRVPILTADPNIARYDVETIW